MFDHFPDMNHDGQKDVHDAIIFHSEMDAVERADREHRRSGTGGSTISSGPVGSPDWAAYVITKGLFIGVPGLFLYLMFTLPLPINSFTAILALLSIVTILRTLTL